MANENHYFSPTRMPMTTKLGKMIICIAGLLTCGLARSRDKLKALYLQYTVSMTMNFGRIVTYI